MKCAVEQCQGANYSFGYCRRHYKSLKKYGDATGVDKNQEPRVGCSIAGCNREHRSDGLCGSHYRSQREHGDALVVDRRYTSCIVEGCGSEARGKATPYCEAHYMRLRRRGTTDRLIGLVEPRVAGVCDQCGCQMDKPHAIRYCSMRCEARSRRGRSEASKDCMVCGAAMPSTRRADSVTCSTRCQQQARYRGISLDWLMQRDAGRCHICKGKVKREDASADHILPFSMGGTWEPSNIALAHLRCNSKRGNGRIAAQMRLPIEGEPAPAKWVKGKR